MDNALVLDMLISKYVQGKSCKVYIAFIDFQKAFDRISWDKLWHKLVMKGLSTKMVRFLTDMYEGTNFSVKVSPGRGAPPYEANIGVKQGRIFFPLLFALYTNDIVEL